MRRRQVLILLSVLAAYPATALAQSKGIPKIGIVGSLNQGAIDAFTDRHAVVKQSKSRLWPKYRHYSSVIVDIFYDHYLAVLWSDYSTEPLSGFASRSYRLLMERESVLPERVRRMLPHMMGGNWLLNYAQVEGIRRALSGMSRRATFESRMEESVDDLKAHYASFESEFRSFFPALESFAESWLATH